MELKKNLGLLAKEAYFGTPHLSESERWGYVANCIAAEVLKSRVTKQPTPISVYVAWGIILGATIGLLLRHGLSGN